MTKDVKERMKREKGSKMPAIFTEKNDETSIARKMWYLIWCAFVVLKIVDLILKTFVPSHPVKCCKVPKGHTHPQKSLPDNKVTITTAMLMYINEGTLPDETNTFKDTNGSRAKIYFMFALIADRSMKFDSSILVKKTR